MYFGGVGDDGAVFDENYEGFLGYTDVSTYVAAE